MCLAKSLDFQIANLRNDGIVFDICNEESAKAYLSANTYLFRIKRYASNFNKHEDGKYKNLDFALLKDLAVIDYELRMALEYLVANAEHELKVQFNNLLMSNSELDGRRIAKLVDPGSFGGWHTPYVLMLGKFPSGCQAALDVCSRPGVEIVSVNNSILQGLGVHFATIEVVG